MSAITVGSEVVYFDRFPLGPIIATWTIDRETRTRWVIGMRHFRKSDLYQIGVSACYRHRSIATRETYDALVAKRAAKRAT